MEKCYFMAENWLGIDKWTEDLRLSKKLATGSCLPLSRGYIHVYGTFSETTRQIEMKFYLETAWIGTLL